MQERRSSNARDSLPDYRASEQNAPPAYPLDDLSEAPSHPKQAHTHMPHDETTSGASSHALADNYRRTQPGLNFDVEANMAAANTDQVAPQMNDNMNNANDAAERPGLTSLDIFANFFLVCAVIFWPFNVFLEFTGNLCHSTTSKVVFCGVPTLALLILWIAMFQQKGFWAISRGDKTEAQYKRMRTSRLYLVLGLVIVMGIVSWQATYWICRDGCADGAGDGKNCIKKDVD